MSALWWEFRFRPRTRRTGPRGLTLRTLLACVVCFAAILQNPVEAKTQTGKLKLPLALNGIKLGDSYTRVLRVMGRPLKETRTHNGEMPVSGVDWSCLLEYDGALIELAAERRSGPFDVVSITVSSNRWKLSSGLQIGMRTDALVTIMGAPYKDPVKTADKRSSLTYVNYDGLGWAFFRFEQGRLSSVQWRYDFA